MALRRMLTVVLCLFEKPGVETPGVLEKEKSPVLALSVLLRGTHKES